jgi:hypothetical protein
LPWHRQLPSCARLGSFDFPLGYARGFGKTGSLARRPSPHEQGALRYSLVDEFSCGRIVGGHGGFFLLQQFQRLGERQVRRNLLEAAENLRRDDGEILEQQDLSGEAQGHV